jgi:hypothetical protein
MIKIIIAFVVGAIVMDFIQLKVNTYELRDGQLIILTFGKAVFSRFSETIVFSRTYLFMLKRGVNPFHISANETKYFYTQLSTEDKEKFFKAIPKKYREKIRQDIERACNKYL